MRFLISLLPGRPAAGSILYINKLGADENAFAPDQPTFLGCPKSVVRYLEICWKQWQIDMQPYADAAIGNISYRQFEEIGQSRDPEKRAAIVWLPL